MRFASVLPRHAGRALLIGLGVVFQACPISAQGIVFGGMNWGTPVDSVRRVLASKGFVLAKKDDEDLRYTGTSLGHQAILWAYIDRGHLVKVTVALLTPDRSAREVYQEMKSSLSEKYGVPVAVLDEFKSPYFDGDGYEDQAIRLGKAQFETIWSKPMLGGDSLLAIEITPALSVRISY
jgi:hypothetical protein